jgi:hypothetical protein
MQLSPRKLASATIVSTFLATMIAYPNAGYAENCSNNGDIAVGGVVGFKDLANPENTRLLRSSCRIRLYLHQYAWITAPPDIQRAILLNFQGNGIPIMEINKASNPETYFKNDFVKLFLSKGVKSTEIQVNGFQYDHPLLEWTEYVDAARRAGVSTVAPIFSPNSGQFRKGEFSSHVWDNVRAAATYGGGLTIDAPPDFFFSQGKDYQKFTMDEIRWAKANRVRSAVIVSPGQSEENFLNLTKRFLQILREQGAVPDEYIVENYQPNPPPTYQNSLGNDNSTNSIVGVALWMTKYFGPAETHK